MHIFILYDGIHVYYTSYVYIHILLLYTSIYIHQIPGYPTWEISGKLYPGEKTLPELADILNGGGGKGKSP